MPNGSMPMRNWWRHLCCFLGRHGETTENYVMFGSHRVKATYCVECGDCLEMGDY